MFEFDTDKFVTEKFITEVQSRPAIWNVEAPEYSIKIEKLKAWDEMCSVMYPNFEDKKPLEKKKLCKILQRKWRSLRDSFTRELNAQQKELQSGIVKLDRKQYVYFKRLIFLLTSTEKRKAASSRTRVPVSKLPENLHSLEHQTPESELEQEESQVAEEENEKKSSSPNRRPEDLLSIELKVPQDMSERLPERKQSAAYLTAEGQDRLFLLSLENDLNKIPEEYKLDAKSEMILVLRKWQRQQTSSQAFTAHSSPVSTKCVSTQTSSVIH